MKLQSAAAILNSPGAQERQDPGDQSHNGGGSGPGVSQQTRQDASRNGDEGASSVLPIA